MPYTLLLHIVGEPTIMAEAEQSAQPGRQYDHGHQSAPA